jgi:hypothetical protein
MTDYIIVKFSKPLLNITLLLDILFVINQANGHTFPWNATFLWTTLRKFITSLLFLTVYTMCTREWHCRGGRTYSYVRLMPGCKISGFHGNDTMKTAFLGTTPCSLVEVDRRFRDASCLYHQALIILMKEVVRISETSVNYKITRYNIPEGCHFMSTTRPQGAISQKVVILCQLTARVWFIYKGHFRFVSIAI